MKRPIARLSRIATAILIVSFVAALRADEPAQPSVKESPASGSPAVEPAPIESGPAEAAVPDKRPAKDPQPLDWPVGLERARQRALADGKPLLVRAGAPWCPWCPKLLEQIETPEVNEQLKRWALVYINIDETPAEARQLSIGPIPALRVVNAAGKVVASQDGYLERDELLSWLKESFDRAALDRPDVLLSEKEVEPGDVDKLIKLLPASDPLVREAALRRLMPHQKLAAASVVEAFVDGKLATRLLTLELLAHWRAPVESLDPWRPETVTSERIQALQSWTEAATVEPAPAATQLSAEDLQAATDALDRLAEIDDAEAAARIEQLARFGVALRPLVVERLKAAASDRAHERLLLLRYRLAASDALVLSWTGGLARLASGDVNVRHQAVTQLVERATAADEPLLLELFADADPLVREISLRGLQTVGTSASSSTLVKLLDDPEPNVRAAVLKQLAESPDAAIIPKIAAYLKTETDPDLVVHGIRVLKAAKTPANLIELLHHPSWQVRAEAAEALGTLVTPHNPNAATANIYAALIEVLSDEDPFVISRAVHALKSSNLPSAVDPLAKAAAEHPELAADVIEILIQGNLRQKAEGILRRYLDHQNPQVRAEAIKALATTNSADAGDLIERGLKDPATEVRVATAKLLLQLCNQLMSNAAPSHVVISRVKVAKVRVAPKENGGVLSALGSIFFGPAKAVPAEAPPKKAQDGEKPAADGEKPPQDDEKPPQDGEKAPQDDEEPAEEVSSNDAAEAVEDDPRFVAFRQGKGRPEWMNGAIAPLETMLQADSAAEKMAAAIALLPLGRDEPALPVLRALMESQHALLDEAGQALPWLLWPERLKFFDELLAQKPDNSQLNTIATQMIVRDRKRGLSRLWKLLEADDPLPGTAPAVGRAIFGAYTAISLANDQMKLGKDDLDELTRYASQGTAWQKNIAIARLVEASADNASELAKAIYEDPGVAAAFRHDAFQLMLIAAEEKEAAKIAVGEIAASDLPIRKLALLYLAGGRQAIGSLRGGLHVEPGGQIYRPVANEVVTIEPPAGVTGEMLKPLLADPDDEVAAAAGYLIALLGDPAGMPTLVRAWRGHKGSHTWTQLLYRAIASLDDDQNTTLLLEINSQLSKWEKPQFYWTIRSMHGPAVLKLRKQIRDEVGMENLR